MRARTMSQDWICECSASTLDDCCTYSFTDSISTCVLLWLGGGSDGWDARR